MLKKVREQYFKQGIMLTWAGRPVFRLCRASRSWLKRSPTTSFWLISSISVARWPLLWIRALCCRSRIQYNKKETLISIGSIRDIRNAKDSRFLKQKLYKWHDTLLVAQPRKKLLLLILKLVSIPFFSQSIISVQENLNSNLLFQLLTNQCCSP